LAEFYVNFCFLPIFSQAVHIFGKISGILTISQNNCFSENFREKMINTGANARSRMKEFAGFSRKWKWLELFRENKISPK
jgi:hypothetical protein